MWNGALSMGTGLSSSWASTGCASAQASTTTDVDKTGLMEFLPWFGGIVHHPNI
jgi:hypothetical protein